MRTLRDIVAHPYAPAFGARVDSDEEPKEGVASSLRIADGENLDWVRSNWSERNEAEFEWDYGGRKVRDKTNGDILKIRTGWPVGAPLESDIQTFVVRDSRIVLLGKPGAERPPTVFHGTFGGRQIPDASGPPEEGRELGMIY